jgi:ParB family transcriptional regulator, chromosome partitioning protein
MSKRARQASPVLSTAAALINETSKSLVGRETRFHHTFEAPIERIAPHPDQARTRFDEAEIRALAGTMAARGQLQPILLRKHPTDSNRWIIVAGERRWRAARLNGWSTILAIEYEGDPEILSLIENLQRVDLTPVEEARGLQRLITDKVWTQSAAAEALGKSKAEVSAILRILTLPAAVLDAVLTSELEIPKNALIELARIENAVVRDRLIERARQGELTIRAIRDVAATTDGSAGEKSTSSPRRRSNDLLSIKALDRLTRSLSEARATGRALSAIERDRLTHLRDEIEQILAWA